MIYSFNPSESQQVHSIYAQMADPTIPRNPTETIHLTEGLRIIPGPYPYSESKAEMKIKKDTKNLEEE